MRTPSLFNKYLLVILLSLASACGTVKSSELENLRAENLNIILTILETNADTSIRRAETSALITLAQSSSVVEFSSEENVSISSVNADANLTSYNMEQPEGSNSNSYEATLDMAAPNTSYTFRFKDRENQVSLYTVAANSVPALNAPTANQNITKGSQLALSWTPNDLASVTIMVQYPNGINQVGTHSFKTPNTGNYTVDLGDSDFDDMISGTGTISISNVSFPSDTQHTSDFNSMSVIYGSQFYVPVSFVD